MTRRTDVGDRVGEYVLEAKLGQGSFGEVWKARHRALDDFWVAVKLPRDARALARLRDEGTLARRVESDAAVKLLGLDLEHDPPYLAMQFVDGESLREVLKRGALPPRRAIEIARRVFAALAAAHDAKVIHRDVKPENILIDRAGVAYLADFGLAAALDDGSVDLGSLGSQRTVPICGTVRHLSPEQKDPRRAIDGRSDLYSAGLVFFEMLTGTLPEGGELPSDLVPSLDKHYDAIFAKCYARLERRFKSAKDVVESLDRLAQRLDAPKIVASLLTGATVGPGPTGPGFVLGARDPRLLRPAPEKSPVGNPNLIGWDEARAILRVQDQDLQRFVDRGAISRVSFGGRLLFRRSDVVETKSRLRRILTPGGLDYYVLPKPQPPRRERPAVVETATNTCALPWLAPSTKLRPAGALVRSFAFGVDALAVGALAVVLGTELFSGPALLLTYLLGGSELCLTPGVLDAASIGVLAFLYFSLLTGLLGRTFGKWLFGLKVTDATGEPLGVGRSAARTLGYVVSATPLGLGFLGIVLHPEHRGFHDLVADSVVAHE